MTFECANNKLAKCGALELLYFYNFQKIQIKIRGLLYKTQTKLLERKAFNKDTEFDLEV